MGGILDGKVAVVTGGGTGIGEATARRFAAEGCKVVVCGRRQELIDRVAAEISALAVVADVAVESEVVALFRSCERTYGGLDILVNNAGVTGPIGNAEDLDMAAWDAMMAINVRGVALCTKHAIPLMKRRGGGSIINVSSRLGLRGYPTRSAYCASKFAVIGMTESVAHEVGVHGIRVNAICPGAVSGELMQRVIAKRVEREGKSADEIIRKNYTDPAALRKWVEPEEVAAAILFLASDQASAITAERVKVDAGRM